MTFPVDFFEHNQQLTEVEFGGNDLLQVYNGQQIKHRLNSTGMYVANTKVGTIKPNDSVLGEKSHVINSCLHQSIVYTQSIVTRLRVFLFTLI